MIEHFLLIAAYWLLNHWIMQTVKEYAIMRDDPKISLQVVYFKLFISSYNKNTHFNFYDWQFTFNCSPHHEWGVCHIVKLAFQFTVDRRARYRREDPDPLYYTWLMMEEVELELHPSDMSREGGLIWVGHGNFFFLSLRESRQPLQCSD